MNKFLTIIFGIGLALLGLAAATKALIPAPFDPVAYEKAQIAIDQAHAVAPAQIAAGYVYILAPALAVIAALVLLTAWGSVAIFRFRHERQPDSRGLLPVDESDLGVVAPRALGAFHAARQIEASQQPVPHTITYSPAEHYAPRFDYDHRGDASRDALPAPTESDSGPEQLPGITDLAQIGFRPTKEAILLGLGPGGEQITVPMRQLWHIGTAGPTGAGKSNIARLIIPQLQAIGAKVAIIDPKWTPYDAAADEDWRPIAARLFLPPASKTDEISETIRYFHDELERRLDRRKAGEKPGDPLFLYADEYTTITEDVKDAGERVARLARLGRGVGIFLLIAAHDLLVKSGAGDTRDQLRTGYYLGGDSKTGSVLLDMPMKQVIEREGDLGQGLAMLRSATTSPARLVRVPFASNQAIAALLGAPSEAPTDHRPMGFRPTKHEGANEGATEGATEGAKAAPLQAHQNAELLTAEEKRIVAAFLDGKSPSDLAAELAGGKKSGDAYTKASRRVAEILRRALGQSA